MKAFVLRAYGSPDQLELTELDQPVPASGEVLVRVRATSVNPYDWHGMRGEPRIARLMIKDAGLRRPKLTILGCDMAGQVEAVGEGVTRFRPGDDVFAVLEAGGFAQYVSVPENLLSAIPKGLTHEQAAAMPMAALTALIAVREQGRVQPGQLVMVNGASGGVGTFAVQIAKAFGATVTGVCSTRSVDLVRSIGADEVIDYNSADFTRLEQRHDVLIDVAGSRPVWACRRVLTRKGTLVVVGGPGGRWIQPVGHVFSTLAAGLLSSQRIVLADAVGCKDKQQMLATLAQLVEDKKVTPIIERSYSFEELPAAVTHVEQGHPRGKVVVTVQ